MPNPNTDMFSLAVILFMIFINNHPLEGSKTTVTCLPHEYDKRFFGKEPVFIFDPKDSSNRPVKGLHVNAIQCWPYFPNFVKDMFCRAFSKESLSGQVGGNGRVLEQEWEHILMNLKSSIVICPRCKSEVFLNSAGQTVCCDCGQKIRPEGFIRFKKKRTNIEIIVPIFKGVKMYKYHIDALSDDFNTVAATILEKPDKMGLRNESDKTWTLRAPDGREATKQPGEVCVLRLGLTIDFGKGNEAEIIQNKN